MPDTLDQMTIAVEAGLGFDSAMARAGKNGKGPLAEELVRTMQDIQVGQSRRQAYESLASRTGVPDLRKFVRAIIQADLYGISVADVLRTQAAEMRMKRRQRAEEKAMQIPVKVIFPLMLCILPVLFIVLLGPAAMDIVAAFIVMALHVVLVDRPGDRRGSQSSSPRGCARWPVPIPPGSAPGPMCCSPVWAARVRRSGPGLGRARRLRAVGARLALLVVIDLAVYRLPDVIVGPMYPILLVALTVAGRRRRGLEPARSGRGRRRRPRCRLPGPRADRPVGLGLGDVKLAGLLGAFLGWAGWPNVFVGTLAAFALNGVVAAVLLLSRRATRKSATAFGPWMVAGAAIGALWGSRPQSCRSSIRSVAGPALELPSLSRLADDVAVAGLPRHQHEARLGVRVVVR